MKRAFYVILAVVTVVAVGCCPCRYSRKYAKPLKGTEWHLIQLSGRDVHFDSNTFNLTFGEDGRIMGRGDCNTFTALYSVTDKEGLDIGTIASTRMNCPRLISEQNLYAELDAATHYEITGSMLFILNNGEIRAIFSAPADDSTAKTKGKKSAK